jgi:hypothetical protein
LTSAVARRNRLRRFSLGVAVALAALFATGCVPRGRPVLLVNDTGEGVVVQTLSVQTVKAQTLPPGARQTTYPLRTGASGYRLTIDQGAHGCLTVDRRQATGPAEVLLFSNATTSCPTVPLAGFFHATLTIGRVFSWLPLFGYVIGPVCAGVWIVLWARRTPGKSVELAVLELIWLCVLSVVILLLLLHWGPPQL